MNEYLNDCEVIEDGIHKWISPMEWIEKLVINGIQLEAFTTSGGLGTMCETYLGRDFLDNRRLGMYDRRDGTQRLGTESGFLETGNDFSGDVS